MARLLLNLRNVPDDEAEDVRALLTSNSIAFYETKPNRWGISGGGIWIRHDTDADQAKRLMADYQNERLARARAEYEAARRDGTAETLWTVLRRSPLRVVGMLAAIIAVLALSAVPFILLLR